LGDTCYRDFLGTNLFNAAKVARINPAFLADAVGTSSIVLTSDGFLVLGRRSDRVAFHAGYMHTFGGMLEAADRRTGGYDLFGGLKREVMEELGVCEGEIGSVVLTGLARDRAIRQPEMLFDLGVTLTRMELSARFHPGLSDGEHTAIEFVPDDPEAIIRFLVRTSRIAPVAQAGLLLHGKHNWSADWYEQSCYLLYGGVPSATAES
jgi:8-oxo-dGTP pyrophosphatase MutT (NUDIX family)